MKIQPAIPAIPVIPANPVRLFRHRLYHWRRFLLIPAAGLVLAGASCDEKMPDPPPTPPPVTDTRPVGEGLKVIGFAMLGAAVVVVLGRLLN